jgi:hypothetical protein
MKSVELRKPLLGLWCACLFLLMPAAFAADETDSDGAAEATAAVNADVRAATDNQTAERRKKIMQGAVEALAQTKDALKALDEARIDDALDALAMATGKLELLVARDPELALAPTDVSVSSHDIYGSADAIRIAIKAAEKALDKGEVQKARRILDGMGSEIVLTVTNLPLATYPDAIKAITPLIDDGKIDEARRALQTALNTLVLTDQIVPLPVLRSEALLARAEELAEKADRNDEENEELTNHLSAVRNQLEVAALLGYGDKDDYEPLYAQLDQIARKTEGGDSGKGMFDKFKTSITDLWDSIFS